VNAASALSCGCGYTFGQPIETTLAQLDDRIRDGRKWAVGGGLCLGLGLAAAIATAIVGGTVLVPLLPMIFGFVYLPRGLRRLRGLERAKRELLQMRQLPTARVIDR